MASHDTAVAPEMSAIPPLIEWVEQRCGDDGVDNGITFKMMLAIEGRARPLRELLDLFASLRAESLDTLDAMRIGPRELELTAQHPGLGQVTLRQLLASWVVHDLGHIVQVSRTLARQLRDDVGPWTAYLGVLGVA